MLNVIPHGEMCFSEEGILTKDELRQCCAGDARRGKEIEKASPVSCLGLTSHTHRSQEVERGILLSLKVTAHRRQINIIYATP